MKKIEKAAWFTEGFAIMETDGFSKITIENLCARLKITKGSFYHHFKNVDGYINAFMEYWLEKNTLNPIRETEDAEDGLERNALFYDFTANTSPKTEQIIRAWGYSNESVKKRVEQADKIRLKYLASLSIKEGKSAKESKNLAMLEYATLIGIQQLFPSLSKKELSNLQQFYLLKQ